MSYDVRIHLPTQIENMLQAETLLKSHNQNQINPLELFMNSVENMKLFFSENGFIQDLNDYEKERDRGIDEAKNLFIDEWKQALNMKTVDDKLKDLVKAESELEHRINEINFDYMNTVKTYVFSYIQHTHVA